jgi:osmotically-inducible protein OsmY
MKSDSQLKADIADELRWDPRVDDREIAVFTDEGLVTLRGTVGSLGAKYAATSAAKNVWGVRDVDNELEVRLLAGHRHSDAELRGTVLKALSWNVFVPDGVDATVKDGVVTLTGRVDYRSQRNEAEAAVRNLKGVAEIHDEISVRNAAMAADLSHQIEKAFKRTAKIDAHHVKVEAVDGTVTLSGTVESPEELDAALDAAWAAPGVENVKDEIEVVYAY